MDASLRSLSPWNRTSVTGETVPVDYHFASSLGWSDIALADLEYVENGEISLEAPNQLLLSVGAPVLPSELGLTVTETVEVFDSSHVPEEFPKGLDMTVSNPPRIYDDGRVNLIQHVLSPSVLGRSANVLLDKEYAWVRSMTVEELDSDRGFNFEMREVYQLDGEHIDSIPLVENGKEARDTNAQLVISLLSERLQNNTLEDDPDIHGEVSDVEFDEDTGDLTYTITSSSGSSLIPNCLNDLISSGLVRRKWKAIQPSEKNEWSITLSFEVFSQDNTLLD